MALGEWRGEPKRDRHHGHRDERRVRKEPARASRSGDRQTEIGGQTQSRKRGEPQLRHGSFFRARVREETPRSDDQTPIGLYRFVISPATNRACKSPWARRFVAWGPRPRGGGNCGKGSAHAV